MNITNYSNFLKSAREREEALFSSFKRHEQRHQLERNATTTTNFKRESELTREISRESTESTKSRQKYILLLKWRVATTSSCVKFQLDFSNNFTIVVPFVYSYFFWFFFCAFFIIEQQRHHFCWCCCLRNNNTADTTR